jgi:YidC/Oxa1 family membrane protein insertase
MERNAIIATVLVIGILLGYQWYLSRVEVPVQEPPRPPATQTDNQKMATPAAAPPAAITAKVPTLPRGYTPTAQRGLSPKNVTIETPLVRVVMSTTGARATAWQLKAFKIASGAPVDLVAISDLQATPGPLAAWADPEQIEGVFEVDKDRLELTQAGTTGTLTFKHVSANGIQLEKQLSFHADRYDIEVSLAVRNLSGDNATAQTRFAWGPGLRNSTDKKASTIQPPTLWVDGKRVQEDLAKISGERVVEGKLSWAALQDTYFTAALLPMEKDLNAFVSRASEEQPIVGLIGPKQTLPASGEAAAKIKVYAGPRDLDLLRGVGHNLDQLIDLGWFDFLARPALWLLKFLYHYTGNYGIAIILITILQKIAFHPLTHKSMKSMQAMQAIQPKVQALQERYKNNPQKKQEETMALYRKHGVNPMGGCLPMLAQIPIFIALYNALSSSVEMWQARFLWISDLTQPDSLFSVAVWGGYVLTANVLALLMGVSMWVQQKMSPTTGDPRQAQMMLWMMPIIFTFMFWSFPSGLVLYWLVNNILQVGQQWLINRGPARPSPAEGQPA